MLRKSESESMIAGRKLKSAAVDLNLSVVVVASFSEFFFELVPVF